MEKANYQRVPGGRHLAAARRDGREGTWGHAWKWTAPRALQVRLGSPWARVQKGPWKGSMKLCRPSEIVQLLDTGSSSPLCAMLIPKIINGIFHSLAHVFFLQQAMNTSVVSWNVSQWSLFKGWVQRGNYPSQAEVAKSTFSSNP